MENLGHLLSDLTTSEPYKFTPLQHSDSIRLLTLHAGEASTPIQISISEARFKNDLEYAALSYTWATKDGDSVRSCSVGCGDKHIKATKNCEAALRRLRHPDAERVLWVDAICIDQENSKERGHQVALMRDIYSKATEVLIWLGRASRRIDEESGLSISDMFLRYIGLMAAEMRELEHKHQPLTSSPLYRAICTDADTWISTKKKTSLIRGLLDILHRRWWERIWVVQEAALAKAAFVLCSNQSAKYSDIFLFYQVLRHDYSTFAVTGLHSKLSSSFKHLSTVRRAAGEITDENLSMAICKSLRMVRHLQASDPRDRIFGILGLSSAFAFLLPKPDYSTTASDVFCGVARALISHSRSLQILTEANAESSLAGHPSWVPDWSIPVVLGLPDPTSSCYNATRDSEAEFEISSNNKELWVAGKGVDSVAKISLTSHTAYEEGSSGWKKIAGLQESCSLGLSLAEYPTGESVQEALWRTLCWNFEKRRSRYPAPAENGVLFEEWRRIVTAGKDPKCTTRELETKNCRFNELVRSRRTPLCITAKGFMASVPYTAEVGDQFVLLSGGRVPFVIRPVEDHYRLVGPCYVHGGGIMDGDAFPENPEDLEWFSIC